MVPRAVLMKSGLVSVNTARQVNAAHSKTIVNAARPMLYFSKIAHPTNKRPIHKNTTFKNCNFNQRVNTVKDKNVNTAKPKAVVNAAKPKAVVNVVKGNNVNAVKASACWVWKPKTKVLDHGNPQMDLQDQGVINSGCSRHMTGNMSYLTDYEEIDGGYVAFGGNPKGGKITGRGTIKTGNLDFENVYFVRELKFNLFSVSQMCDKNISVLFNDTECIVLSPNFKLTDESQVLLKVHRKNNMYNVDLKNIVPKGGLTYLFAKAISYESKLWHRRLGHINFKTMNKLVKGNLVWISQKSQETVKSEQARTRESEEYKAEAPKARNLSQFPFWITRLLWENSKSLLSSARDSRAGVSTEDAVLKISKILPSAWLQVSLMMRNKPGMDVSHLFLKTSSTNDVSTAYGVSNTSGHYSKHEQTSSYSLLASQSSCPQLDHEDLDQVDEYDLKNWT
ncbi:ribonuclease H-like domain-containing protein [Tanacetum coccineum]